MSSPQYWSPLVNGVDGEYVCRVVRKEEGREEEGNWVEGLVSRDGRKRGNDRAESDSGYKALFGDAAP